MIDNFPNPVIIYDATSETRNRILKGGFSEVQKLAFELAIFPVLQQYDGTQHFFQLKYGEQIGDIKIENSTSVVLLENIGYFVPIIISQKVYHVSGIRPQQAVEIFYDADLTINRMIERNVIKEIPVEMTLHTFFLSVEKSSELSFSFFRDVNGSLQVFRTSFNHEDWK